MVRLFGKEGGHGDAGSIAFTELRGSRRPFCGADRASSSRGGLPRISGMMRTGGSRQHHDGLLFTGGTAGGIASVAGGCREKTRAHSLSGSVSGHPSGL